MVGEGRTLEKPVPGQLHGQACIPPLLVGGQILPTLSLCACSHPPWEGKGALGKSLAEHLDSPDCPSTRVPHPLCLHRACCRRLTPPWHRLPLPMHVIPHWPHRVTGYLSLEAQLQASLCHLPPVAPQLLLRLHFPGSGPFLLSFSRSENPSRIIRGPVSALLLLMSRASGPPPPSWAQPVQNMRCGTLYGDMKQAAS